jgi:two-component system phosphate regulon sensor histidine kinase PhoR
MKLFLTYAALIVFAIIILGSGFTWYIKYFFLETVRQRLAEEARIAGELLKPLLEEPTVIGTDPNGIDLFLLELGLKTSARITLVAPDGTVLGDSDEDREAMDNHLMRPEIQATRDGEAGSAIRFSRTVNKDMLYVAVTLDQEDPHRGYIRLALPLSDLNLTISRVRYALLAGLMGVLAITLSLSLKLSGSLTKPLEQMSDVAKKIAGGELNSRVRHSRRDELGDLGWAINDMAESLEKKVCEISAARDRLDAILSTMVDGIFVFDTEGRAIMANPAAECMFGLTRQGWYGRHDLEIIRNVEMHEKIESARHENRVFELEITLNFPHKKDVVVSIVPIKTNGLDSDGVLAVFHDITRQKKLEKMRSDFAANVTHELRTPLTTIRGFAETIHESAYEDAETSRRFARIIQREAERLGGLIEDILTLSKIESGKVETKFIPIKVEQLLPEVLKMFTGRTGNHHVEIKAEEGLWVHADRALLGQALFNLLDNALKYTPSGGHIEMGAEKEGENVRLYVKDNGIGIPQEAQERIFERFYRVDRARSRRQGGTGLGLAIVKHIVEAHHGKLTLKSNEGKGTEVGIVLTAHTAD